MAEIPLQCSWPWRAGRRCPVHGERHAPAGGPPRRALSQQSHCHTAAGPKKGRQEIPEGDFEGEELHSVRSLGGWCASDSLKSAWRVELGKNGVPDKI